MFKNKKVFEKFENGEVDYLIGFVIYYGFFVRGIDLLYFICYVVFMGVLKFCFSIDFERLIIYCVLGLFSEIMDFFSEEDRR